MSDEDERVERVEPPADRADPRFDDIPREDYADIDDDKGDAAAARKEKKADGGR